MYFVDVSNIVHFKRNWPQYVLVCMEDDCFEDKVFGAMQMFAKEIKCEYMSILPDNIISVFSMLGNNMEPITLSKMVKDMVKILEDEGTESVSTNIATVPSIRDNTRYEKKQILYKSTYAIGSKHSYLDSVVIQADYMLNDPLPDLKNHTLLSEPTCIIYLI